MEKLTQIQNELKVPKGNYNSFGKYKYRSCEDILEAVKPILLKYEANLILTDEVVYIGTKLFLKATAKLNEIVCYGYAELSEHKGMSAEQTTGTASSYARKYALNGLFLIDETEQDADHDNKKELPTLDLKGFEYLTSKGTKEQIKTALNERKMTEAQRETLIKILK